MPSKLVVKITNKINSLLAQKEKKTETVKNLNDEIKKIDAEIKKLSDIKTSLEKAESDAEKILEEK